MAGEPSQEHEAPTTKQPKNDPNTPPPLSAKMKKIKRLLPSLCLLCYIGAIVSLSYYPTDLIANNSYMSENALQPGVAESTFGIPDHLSAIRYTTQFIEHVQQYQRENITLSRWTANWIEEQLEDIGLDDIYTHTFDVKVGVDKNGAPMFAQGVNTVGIIRSHRTGGREALVLTASTRHKDFDKQLRDATSSMGLSLALLKNLRKSNWLSKDLIFVASDGNFGDEGIRTWLENYHNVMKLNPSSYYFTESAMEVLWSNFTNSIYEIHDQTNFVRSGQIRGALTLDFYAETYSYIVLCPEGLNGKLPNLDLMNTFDRVAIYSENSYTTLFNEDDPVTQFFYNVDGFFNFGHLSFNLAQLFTFMIHGAIGQPTGDHGWFHMYNIDAVTVRLYSGQIPGGKGAPTPILKLGRILEGMYRSMSNLVERFHQSFYFYLLSATFRYISIGEYMITFGMVIVPMGLFLVSSFIGEFTDATNYLILRAVPRTVVFYTGGLIFYWIVCLLWLEYFGMVIIFVLMSLLLIRIASVLDKVICAHLYPNGMPKKTDNEKQLEATCFTLMTFCPVMLYLTTFSLMNFCFCLFAGILIGPAIFVFRPTHRSKKRDMISAVLLLLTSLPVILWIPAIYYPSLDANSVLGSILWLYYRYSSIILPFLTVFYYPFNLALFSCAAFDI